MRSIVLPFGLLTAASAAVIALAPGWAVVDPVGAPAMFRGDPAHAGVSSARLFRGQPGARWSVRTDDAVRSTPAIAGGRLYVGSGDGKLYAIDRATGRVAWTFAAGGRIHASPAVASGLVVAATLEGRVFAVDARTGRLRWSLTTGPALPLNAVRAGGWDYFASSPTVVGGLVLVGAGDGIVRALDLASGRERWRARTGGRVRATPAVADSLVVVGSWDGRVYALDLATGAERWVHRPDGDTLDSDKFGYDRRAVQSSAAIADGMVFVGSRDGGLYGLDLATGERRWRASHGTSWVVGSPAVSGGRVYVGSSDGRFIHAVEAATGREVWRVTTGANVLSSPLLVDGLLVVGTNAGDLLALDPGTGARRWRLRLEDAVLSSPVAADGELHVGTDAGTVVAVHEIGPAPARLAVFYDSTLARQATVPGARFAWDYFRQVGYESLDADSLAAFLRARIADGAPSVVVFALDALPAGVAPDAADTVLFRRYLDAGGKVVWLGLPPLTFLRDSTGKVTGYDLARPERLIGVPTATLDFDQHPAHPTPAGRRWGLDRAVRGELGWDPSAVSEVLATDETGKATAWVRRYRADRPGTGFVQLWGAGARWERMAMIRAVAEYGLTRDAMTVTSPSSAAGPGSRS